MGNKRQFKGVGNIDRVEPFWLWHNNVQKLREKHGNRWLYIGRWNKHGVTRSPLANPYYRPDDPPGATLPDYRKWLWLHMKAKDMAVLRELRKIKIGETVLICHCGNANCCHGSIIWKAVRWLNAQDRK